MVRSTRSKTYVAASPIAGEDLRQIAAKSPKKPLQKPVSKQLSKASPDSSDSEDDRDYEVERLLGKRVGPDGFEYLVHWKGFSSDYDTWEPVDVLAENCSQIIVDFEKYYKYPNDHRKDLKSADIASESVNVSSKSKQSDASLGRRTASSSSKPSSEGVPSTTDLLDKLNSFSFKSPENCSKQSLSTEIDCNSGTSRSWWSRLSPLSSGNSNASDIATSKSSSLAESTPDPDSQADGSPAKSEEWYNINCTPSARPPIHSMAGSTKDQWSNGFSPLQRVAQTRVSRAAEIGYIGGGSNAISMSRNGGLIFDRSEPVNVTPSVDISRGTEIGPMAPSPSFGASFGRFKSKSPQDYGGSSEIDIGNTCEEDSYSVEEMEVDSSSVVVSGAGNIEELGGFGGEASSKQKLFPTVTSRFTENRLSSTFSPSLTPFLRSQQLIKRTSSGNGSAEPNLAAQLRQTFHSQSSVVNQQRLSSSSGDSVSTPDVTQPSLPQLRRFKDFNPSESPVNRSAGLTGSLVCNARPGWKGRIVIVKNGMKYFSQIVVMSSLFVAICAVLVRFLFPQQWDRYHHQIMAELNLSETNHTLPVPHPAGDLDDQF